MKGLQKNIELFNNNRDDYKQRYSNTAKSLKTEATKRFGNSGSLKGKALLIFFALLITGISKRGIMNCEAGIKYAKDEDSKKTILTNQKIFQFCLGFGSGLIVYTICSGILSATTIIIPAIIICVMSGITITAFQDISDDKNCNKDKIQKTYALMYGFIGAGIGMILATGFIGALSKFNFRSYHAPRILAIFLAILLITLCSIDINTVNNTTSKSPTSKSASVITLIFAVISIIGLGVSFKYFK